MDRLQVISHCRDFHDANLCPVKPLGDPGDVIHRIGLQAIEWYLKTEHDPVLREVARGHFVHQLNCHYYGNGNFCRYHLPRNGGDWWTKDHVFSRDQMTPILIACGLYGLTDWVNKMYDGLKARDGVFWNSVDNQGLPKLEPPDIAFPQTWGLFDRAKGFMSPTGSTNTGDVAELSDTYAVIAATRRPKVWIPWPVSKWHYPFGESKRHTDPVNKTMILLYNKMTFESDHAREARILYNNHVKVWHSWKKYWVRRGDPQCPFHEVFKPYILALGKDTLL